jgi:hypothetical protein
MFVEHDRTEDEKRVAEYFSRHSPLRGRRDVFRPDYKSGYCFACFLLLMFFGKAKKQRFYITDELQKF